jgi:hypothetical protein
MNQMRWDNQRAGSATNVSEGKLAKDREGQVKATFHLI